MDKENRTLLCVKDTLIAKLKSNLEWFFYSVLLIFLGWNWVVEFFGWRFDDLILNLILQVENGDIVC